jgi:putative hydrolase of HD superfamily
MKNILDFLLKTSLLKKTPRTGFVWLGIQNPETIAQHIFRVAIMNWILGSKVKPKLNLEEVIKISLVHDLCEVYAGDMTPYWGLLPSNKKERKEILKKWIRLPFQEKLKRAKIKNEIEKKSLEKLIRNLPLYLKKEILNCWLDYENGLTQNGKFVHQGDKIETLLQAHEYWGGNINSPVFGWWEEAREAVDNPVLLNLLEKIDKRFFYNKKIDKELDFFLEIGKLKTMPRTGWVLRGVRNPETIAEHTFLLAIAVWIFGRRKKLNLEKMLKIALIHEICEIYAGDVTPYDEYLAGNKKRVKEILKRWPRFSKKEKIKKFLKDYLKEKQAFKKLISKLPPDLKKEILNLWDEYKRRLTPEGNFVSQIYWLVTYMQALQYWEKNKRFPILAWYEQIREFIDEPIFLKFLNELEKWFLLVFLKRK